jgi:hypothetical protein
MDYFLEPFAEFFPVLFVPVEPVPVEPELPFAVELLPFWGLAGETTFEPFVPVVTPEEGC